MTTLKELYDNNVNIMQYMRDQTNSKENTSSAILTSYDMQAGSYVKNFENNAKAFYYDNGKKSELETQEVYKRKFEFIKDKFNQYISLHNDKISFLEAGTGEATSLVSLMNNLSKHINFLGFDISLSRIQAGNSFCQKHNVAPQLFCADMLNIPLADNSIDIVFTSHAIEPNTNKELKVFSELYRISSQYLILIEPSYELGNDETKKNIEKHCYIKNLKGVINKFDCEILFHDLLPVSTYSNMSEMFIIRKKDVAKKNKNSFVCPCCKKELILHNGNYFCSDCLTVYPVLNNIPDLNVAHSILFSQYLDK